MSVQSNSFSHVPSEAVTHKVAAVQMASGTKVEGNLNEARRHIEKAASLGAKLVVLPEFFPMMSAHEADILKIREPDGEGVIQSFLSDVARQYQLWLVGGSIPLQSARPDKVRSSCLVFDDQGRRVARYDKIHLFNLNLGQEQYREDNTIEAGNQVEVIDTPFGRMGLAICYDLRFPELFRAMSQVDLIVLPAAFTATTGKVHWEPLIRARAIENLAYVVAAAQGGFHVSGRETHGHSMIVDPWGRILDELPRGSGVVVAEINPGYQTSLRSSLPALSHRTFQCHFGKPA